MDELPDAKAALDDFRNAITQEDTIGAIGFQGGKLRIELFVKPKATQEEIEKHASAVRRLAEALGSPNPPITKYWPQNNFTPVISGRVDVLGLDSSLSQAVLEFRESRGYKEITFWD